MTKLELRKFSVFELVKSYTTCLIILFGPFVVVFYVIWKVVRG